MATALESLQVQQPDAGDLLRRGATIAIARSMQGSEHPILAVPYAELGKNMESEFGFMPADEVKDAFEVAVRQDPSCHAPYLRDGVIIGEFPEPGTARFSPTMVAYAKMLSASLSFFWPAKMHSAIENHDTATRWLRFGHQTGDGDAFSLAHLPTFFEYIRNGTDNRFASLAPGYFGDYVVNLDRFGKAASSSANKIPEKERQALVVRAVEELRTRRSSVLPQALMHDIAALRGEPIHRRQVAPLIGRALRMDGVTLVASDEGEKIVFASSGASPAEASATLGANRTPFNLMVQAAHARAQHPGQ